MDIKFIRIDGEPGIIQHDLDTFAASFDHSVTRLFPIWAAYIDGKIAGYCYLHPLMVAYPAVSPRISPRQFYKVAWTWFSRIKQQYGDPMVMVSQDDKEKVFSKVGLVPCDKHVYLIRD